MNGKLNDTPKVWNDSEEAPELEADFFAQATPHIGQKVVSKGEYAEAIRQRGRPKSATTKVAVKLRLDPDLLAVIKATGPGWQTRINQILREQFAP